MEYYAQDNNGRGRRAAAVALILYIMALLLLWFVVRFNIEYEVAQGNIIVEFGEEAVGEPAEGLASAMPKVSSASSNSAGEPVLTQTTEPAPEVQRQNTATSKPTETQTATTTAREVNQQALFRPSAQSGNGSSTTAGSTGSTGAGEQGAGASDVGVSLDLKGRSAVGNGLVKPDYGVQESGKVIVDIVVNESGKVTEAAYRAKGSTTGNNVLIDAALRAARATVFTAADKSIQEGTITYIFKLR